VNSPPQRGGTTIPSVTDLVIDRFNPSRVSTGRRR
jgi:hypothetical protein